MTWFLSAFADEAGDSAADQIAALRQAKIRRIDVRNIDGLNIGVLPLDHAQRIRAQLDAAGITVAMLGSPIGKSDLADDFAADLAKLHHLAALAPILNCRAIRIFSYYNQRAALPQAEFQKESLHRLRQLKALAADLGLTLYHENESHIFGDHADDVLTLARELRDPPSPRGTGTFRTIFDFGNFNAARENVWDNWLKLRNVTDAIHIKENHWTGENGEKLLHIPAGSGTGDMHGTGGGAHLGGCFIREILADAVKRKFSGPVSVEAHLHFSPAVLATHPTGGASEEFASLSAGQCFQIACSAAREVLTAAGAVVD